MRNVGAGVKLVVSYRRMMLSAIVDLKAALTLFATAALRAENTVAKRHRAGIDSGFAFCPLHGGAPPDIFRRTFLYFFCVPKWFAFLDEL